MLTASARTLPIEAAAAIFARMQAAARTNPGRRSRTLILFLVFLALWFGLRAFNRPEPVYSDQPLSYWLERLSDEKTSAHASAVLNEMGPEALPALVDALRTDSSPLIDTIYAVCIKVHLAAPRHYDAPNIRATAAYLLGQMGEAASPATEYLVKALGDEDPFVRFKAERALSKIGMVAGPELVKTLDDREPIVRYGAAKALGGMGAQARYAVPALLRKLDDPQSNVRVAAFQALAQIGERAQNQIRAEHVPHLLEALTNSPWAGSRKFAVATLRKLGPAAKGAAPTLLAQRNVYPELAADIDAAAAAMNK